MLDLPTYAAFLGAVLAYQLSGIGPDMMLVMSHGVGQGRRAALAAALGCVSAGVVQIPLLALGLASLVMSSPLLYQGMQLVGAAYLIFVGIRFLTAGDDAAAGGALLAEEPNSFSAAFRRGMVCNLTNPTALAFMLAVLPQFVHPSAGSPAMQFFILGGTMKATGLLILGTVALASGTVGGWLSRNASFLLWQRRIAGAVMIALGVRLLLAVAMPGSRR